MALLLSLLPAVSHQLHFNCLQVPERSATSSVSHLAALFAFVATKSVHGQSCRLVRQVTCRTKSFFATGKTIHTPPADVYYRQ